MTTAPRLAVLAAALFVIACVAPAQEAGAMGQDSLQQEILAELQSYYDDLSARDWEAFARHFWPGATMATVWPPPGDSALRLMLIPVEEFIAHAPEGPGSKPIFEERPLKTQITVHGNLAQAWAHYEARFGEEGQIMEWRGIDAFTLLQHEGRWKIISVSYTSEDLPEP